MFEIQRIFRMLSRCAVEIPTFPVDQIPTSLNTWKIAETFFCIAAPQRRAAKYMGYTWYIGKRFCKSTSFLFSSLSPRIELSLEETYWGTASHVYSGEKWKIRTKSRSEMLVWIVSQKFSHLQWRGLFEELWDRRTTTTDLGSPFWQVPYASNLCLLTDKVQDWGLYLITISYGSDAMDQRSGVRWINGWNKIFVINEVYQCQIWKYSMRGLLQR